MTQTANVSNVNSSKVREECEINKTTIPGYCPKYFDEDLFNITNYKIEICWPETPPGTVVNHSCPDISIFDRNQWINKECLKNGTWYTENGNHYVNYSNCFISMDELHFLTLINKLTVIAYTISLVALLISLIIFLSFRTLKCTRIKIHTQLFISFILNNFLWILWYEEVIPYVDVTLDNPLWCQFLHVFKEYFMVANYMWMFCEGLHLHLALVVVFVREEKTLKLFYAIGWGVPVVIVGIHNMIRLFYTNDTKWCWLYESNFSHWFLSIPVLIILGVCTVFLINVLRVILTIMHPNSPNPAPVSIRRAARAALILMPLFGIQYIFLPMVPASDHLLYHFYLWFTFIIIPFQGLCCACLFCFANHDVCEALKACFYNMRHRDMRFSSYRYTGAVDSAGVYVVNGGSLHRKSTLSTKL